MQATETMPWWLVLSILGAALLLLLLLWRRRAQERWRAEPRGGGDLSSPAPAPGRSGRHTVLVLDLDETLVHAVPLVPADGALDPLCVTSPRLRRLGLQVHLRPHVRAFLRRMRDAYGEVVLFTAGTAAYADAVLDDLLDPEGRVFERRFYRQHCAESPPLAKDLRLLGEPLDAVLLLDNTPGAYALQPQNGVPIASFTGDIQDDHLLRAAAVLEAAAASGADLRAWPGLAFVRHAPRAGTPPPRGPARRLGTGGAAPG